MDITKKATGMLNGIDSLSEVKALLAGSQAGLITNPTGVNKRLESTIDLLREHLVCLFGPEHGVRAMVQDEIYVDHGYDGVTGLPEYSLFGENMAPTPHMLENVDTLVFDIQDVGVRFYTYAATMALSMEAAWRLGKRFVVLDRANPLGRKAEGLLRKDEFKSFLSFLPITTRHGMTLGELALMLKARSFNSLDLEIVKTKDWNPGLMACDLDVLWVPPSPNIPTYDCAFVYPGTCLVEGTSVSEGRGTAKPFELIGAPWLNARELADAMNGKNLPGVLFRPAFFTPLEFKHKNIPCQGVQVHVTDPYVMDSVWMGVELINTLREQSKENMTWRFLPEYDRHMIDLLHGDDSLRLGSPLPEIKEKMTWDTLTFKKDVEEFYIY